MEGKLLVTPEELKATASDFQAKATQVKGLHDDMISKVNSMSSCFTGEAASEYSAKFNALQESMDKINGMITEHVKDLNEMADVFILATKTAVAAAQGLPKSTV